MSEYIVDFGSLAMLSRVVESESNRLGEPVVRCMDCKHWRRFYPESEQRFGTCRAWRYTTRFDGYCHNASKSDGERQGE